MSFWKTLAKIGAIAGGGIATAMTGGAASPLLLAAIGAGTGATVGGIDNGWKGALTGGALGAATGGLGGGAASGAKSAVSSGLKSAVGSGVKSLATSPSTYLQLAGDVGSVLGKQQQGAAGGKVSQANLNQQQDQNALASYIAQQNAQNTAANTDLQRKSFESSNRSTTAKQALIGALLGHGITPTSMSGGKASGGLLASFNSNPDAMAAMKMLGQQGSQAQNTPLQFQGGQMLQAPKLTNLPQVDQGGFLSTLAKIGELAGAASPYIKPKARKGQNDNDGQYDDNGDYLGE